jgi:hypothetical protein
MGLYSNGRFLALLTNLIPCSGKGSLDALVKYFITFASAENYISSSMVIHVPQIPVAKPTNHFDRLDRFRSD